MRVFECVCVCSCIVVCIKVAIWSIEYMIHIKKENVKYNA